MTDIKLEDYILGDTLGVPVEFKSRESLRNDPVTDMREHGNDGV